MLASVEALAVQAYERVENGGLEQFLGDAIRIRSGGAAMLEHAALRASEAYVTSGDDRWQAAERMCLRALRTGIFADLQTA